MQAGNRQIFITLTALWAFVESGLGGMMHALHLPFTGIFLGGFSVLVISLIAHFDSRPFGKIIRATLIVMAVKASVNPMTSPMAYIAVGFQGLAGALIYSLPGRGLAYSLPFAMLAMLESAFQKLLIITLIFGKAWMDAIDIYIQSILKIFGVASDSPFSLYAVGLYVLIYFLWGILLGVWAWQLPEQVRARSGMYDDLEPVSSESVSNPRKRKGKLPLILVVSLLVVLSTFFIPGENAAAKAFILLGRTAAVVLLWVFLVLPLWKRFVTHQLLRKRQKEMPEIMVLMPRLSAYVKPLLARVSEGHRGIAKWKEFVIGLIVISLRQDASGK